MYSLDHDVGNLEDENGNYVRHLMSQIRNLLFNVKPILL